MDSRTENPVRRKKMETRSMIISQSQSTRMSKVSEKLGRSTRTRMWPVIVLHLLIAPRYLLLMSSLLFFGMFISSHVCLELVGAVLH
ncbi:hypothetical protein BDZ45DRAFT_234370 [Acephala macrosclerotiorum]|nr:hypothetical protein BDZ45DRAFT_234370 [Acephala macrosclerotiorum]